MNYTKLSILAVVVGVLIIAGGVGAYFLFFEGGQAPAGSTNQNQNQNPSTGGSTGGTVNVPSQTIGSTTQQAADTKTVTAAGGGIVVTKDFLKDPATVKDPVNENHYFVGPHPLEGTSDASASENPPYVIEYNDDDQSFTIGLMQEPLAQTRLDMETFLEAKLGITQSDMCHLNYLVSVPARVNTFYAGYSLGFSFCPDSVAL